MAETNDTTPKASVIEILRQCLSEKMQKNPHYSARAFARDIGVSPAFISMLLSGKKKLSLKRAERVAIALEMSERHRLQFLRAVTLSSLSGPAAHNKALEDILSRNLSGDDVFPMEVDQFKFFSNWYNVAILDLTSTANFKPDVKWMAERLKIPTVMVRDAMDRLLRLGLIKKKNSSYQKTNQHVKVPTKAPESAIQNFHRQMIEKAKETLNQQSPEDFNRREISGITMAIDPKKVDEAKMRIRDFKRQMADLLTEGTCTEVYQLNMQLFPLTTNETGES